MQTPPGSVLPNVLGARPGSTDYCCSVKKFEKLGEAKSPDGTLLTLYRHDGAYTIRVNGVELMSTRRHHSEDALADLVCGPLQHERGVRLLIGGLGLGFTLKAALATLPHDASITASSCRKERYRD